MVSWPLPSCSSVGQGWPFGSNANRSPSASFPIFLHYDGTNSLEDHIPAVWNSGPLGSVTWPFESLSTLFAVLIVAAGFACVPASLVRIEPSTARST